MEVAIIELLCSIWGQEWYRIRAQKGLLLLITLIALGGGLMSFWGLFVHDTQTFEALYECTFDRFFIYYVLLPLTVVTGAMVTRYRLVDSMLCQQRCALYYQTIFQNLITTSLIWLGWSLASLSLLVIRLWQQFPVPFMIANGLGIISLWLVQLIFNSSFLGLYFLFKNKVIAVIGVLAVNVGIFELSMRGHQTLLYEFTKLGGTVGRLGQIWLLIIVIIAINLITYWLVLRREF